MIRSMTGFSRAEGKVDGGLLCIEIKSFNHRFFEFTGRIPPELLVYEEEIKRCIRKEIRRGSINVAFSYTKKGFAKKHLSFDQKLAKRYFNLAQRLRRLLALKENLSINEILSFPGVIVYEEDKRELGGDWDACKRILQKAIKNLLLAKKREGADLLKDISKHVDCLGRSVEHIEQRLDKVICQYKTRLGRRLKELTGKTPAREKIEEEAILYTRNADISEEIIRIKSHVGHFRQLLKSKEEVGRKLDFVAQELYREVNTIGAKANDYLISKEVVEMKSGIEKIREQAQNIE